MLLTVLLCLLGAVTTEKIRIIHTNDIHARFDQTSQLSGKCSDSDAAAGRCYGGFPRITTVVKQLLKAANDDNVPVLHLNAGDTFQGTVYYTIYKWHIVAPFIDGLGLDAMSLGNHEFDDGIAGLAPYLRNVSTPVLACNVGTEKEPDLANTPLKCSLVIERGGYKFGIIGYITPETSTLSKTGNIVFYDEITSLTSEAKRLKESGVQTVIALGHSGYDVDQEIARNVADVDIIVGGHSHSFLYTGTPPDNDVAVGPYPTWVTQPSGKKVPIVQAYAFSKYLGFLEVELDKNGNVLIATGNPILLNNQYTQDPDVLKELDNWSGGIANATLEEIATTRVFLNGTCRFNECNLGNLVSDAFVDYVVRNSETRNWTDAAIAIYSGGGVRAAIAPSDGIVKAGDVMITLPFYNRMSLISLPGKYLLSALEWSVARYDPTFTVGRGEFLQMSGINVKYDLSRAAGSRVVSATARCAQCPFPSFSPIRAEENYNLIVSAFIAGGGDNYSMIAEHKTELNSYDALDTDVVLDYIRKKELIYNGIEGRIKFISNAKSESNVVGGSKLLVA